MHISHYPINFKIRLSHYPINFKIRLSRIRTCHIRYTYYTNGS